MVLQNKYKKRASVKHNKGATPSSSSTGSRRPPPAAGAAPDLVDEGDENAGSDEDGEEEDGGKVSYSRRPLGSNADRYREEEEENDGAEGEEVDPEELAVEAERTEELAAFRAKQLEVLARAPAASAEKDEEAEDVDDSYDHLFRTRAPRPVVVVGGEQPGLREEAVRAASARQLGARFNPSRSSTRPATVSAAALDVDDLLESLTRDVDGGLQGTTTAATNSGGRQRGLGTRSTADLDRIFATR